MLVDEALQIGLREELRRWVPDKFSAKLEFAHASIFLAFRAKSRNPVAKPSVIPRDPSTPLRFAQMTAITASVARTFPEILCSFLCLGRSNCDRGREDKCRQAKLAKASFKNFAPEIGAILSLHLQIIARHGGVSVMTWR